MSLCLVTQARNESVNLNEWLSYYKAIGVEKVYLYCNDDEPAYMYKTVLPWIEAGFVIFEHLSDFDLGGQGDKQIETFMRWIERYKKSHDWATFLDIDEYLTLGTHKNINEYLSSFSKKVDLIFLNWFNFGHNNYPIQAEGRILQAYNRRHAKMSHVTKMIIRTQALDLPFMRQHPFPFQHGIGVGKYAENPFNRKRLNRVFADGTPFVWEGYLDVITEEFSQRMRDIASISHYYMRHTGYYHERAKRGLRHKSKTGSDTYLLHWKLAIDSGGYLDEMARANEFEDNLLKDWSIARYGKSGNGFYH